MTDVTDIGGIGPAKAETLAEEGYQTVEDIANADRDELAEIKGVGSDRSLEFIVEALDLVKDENVDVEEGEDSEGDKFDLSPAEIYEEVQEEQEQLEENEDETGVAADVEESEGVEEGVEEETEVSEPYTITVSFNEVDEFHTFHAAIMRYHEKVFTSDQPASDAMRKILDGLTNRNSVEYELTEHELNTLHTAVKQARTAYQGDNLIQHMDALKNVEEQINEQRNEYRN